MKKAYVDEDLLAMAAYTTAMLKLNESYRALLELCE